MQLLNKYKDIFLLLNNYDNTSHGYHEGELKIVDTKTLVDFFNRKQQGVQNC